MKRKAIPKSVRFEVFKRDSFKVVRSWTAFRNEMETLINGAR